MAAMKHILLVDDDPLVLKLYRDGLSRQGFGVETAADGVAALRAVRAKRPDLMVLDLMMPKLSGVEVLKYLRAEPSLASLPVLVLSNSYMTELTQQAASFGPQKGLLKVACSPMVLAKLIHEVLAGLPTSENPAQLLAVSDPSSGTAREDWGAPASTSISSGAIHPGATEPSGQPAALPPVEASSGTEAEAVANAREQLISHSAETGSALRHLFQSFSTAVRQDERAHRLLELYRRVHFLAVAAGMARFRALWQMATAVEALFFGMMDKPDVLNVSLLRTSALAVDSVAALLVRLGEEAPPSSETARILVLDDDPATSRPLVAALRQAELGVRCTQNPTTALEWMKETSYHLVVVDLEKPELDGLEFCRRVRAMPGYRRTPVLYVADHDDLETRTRSALAGGSDLITKPVLPAEVAVRAVMLLLEREE
jgi:DNA-binding response OmpR family regulator